VAFVTLPAVYLDDLALSAPADVVLMNQAPAPLEDNVAKDALVVLDIAVASGFSLDTAGVLIDGVSAWTLAGGFAVGWNGGGSGTAAVDANTLQVTIDPTIDFTSDATIAVRATGTSAGLTSLDETYEFNVEDTTPPQVASAEAQSLNVVRVTFNEAMLQVLGANSNDAMNPANYSFAPQTLPAVTATAISVESVTTTSVDVTTDIDLSIGVPYLVSVVNAADVSGNVVLPPDHTALFDSFVPTIPAGRNWELWRMLPRINRQEDATGDLHRFILCLQDVVNLILADIDAFSDIIDPDLADEPWLTGMLCDLGNPFNFELSDIDQRRLISILVPLYKQKGTCVGVENAVRFFVGVEVTCVPYLGTSGSLGESELGFDFVLAPSSSAARYTFTVQSPVALTDTQRTQITELANLMKPAHTHLGSIIEPTIDPNHLELGTSGLGDTWELH